jgi:large subunit ribosomal protein L7/L12
MEKLTKEEVVQALGNMTVLEMIALTKKLEAQWGVKAEPLPVVQGPRVEVEAVSTQSEFDVILTSVPADKKMGVIKAVREITLLGLKESKDLVEAAPKMIKEGASKEESEALRVKLTELGAVIELK